MDLPDINILVATFRPDVEHHTPAKAWLEGCLNACGALRLAPMVEAGFVRIVTHPRIFDPPSLMADAREFLQVLGSAPSVETVSWTPAIRERWLFLCMELGLAGNDCNDAMLAAIALERGLRLVSFNRGFSRFPQLRHWNPSSPG